jgi:hypothetical protein
MMWSMSRIVPLALAAQRIKVSGFGQPRNPSEYTAEELAEARSTTKLADWLLYEQIWTLG